ncbi:hypothetical protein EHM76_04605 [bacterium]|nr:MAG: hypothetical protein EHM76_04605 [bacterium]
MNIPEILTLVFGLATTVLGILLKAEYDKRVNLQQQLAERKRSAYAAFNESINDFVLSSKSQPKDIHRIAKQLMELRQGIWQYGSDEVVKAYALWQQCVFAGNDENKLSGASLVLMADFIVKMRVDLGLSKKNSLSSLDILRIFITDVESRYDELAGQARVWRNQFLSKKHETY